MTDIIDTLFKKKKVKVKVINAKINQQNNTEN